MEGSTSFDDGWKPNKTETDHTTAFAFQLLSNKNAKYLAENPRQKSLSSDQFNSDADKVLKARKTLEIREKSADFNSVGGVDEADQQGEIATLVESSHDRLMISVDGSENIGNQLNPANRRHDKSLLSKVQARIQEESLTLSLWDFGGQEAFYTMHHIFLTKTGIYLLIFDIRTLATPTLVAESRRCLLLWLRSMQLHAPNAALFLVGTFFGEIEGKLDIKSVDGVFLTMLETCPSLTRIRKPKYGPSSVFFPIDNKEKVGISVLQSEIEEAAKTDKTMNKNISIRWMAFLDEITKYGNETGFNYLRFTSQVRGLAESVGVQRLSEQEAALSYFHEKGFLIHLDSTETLREIVIVNPQWLIDMLSRVICDPKLHVDYEKFEKAGLGKDAKRAFEKAIVSRDFLAFVWNYDQVDFLIDLMKRTMLLSQWVGKDAAYFVPSLLQEKRIAQAITESVGQKVKFDFSSSFLATGIFQRLVCLCFEYRSRRLNVDNEFEVILKRDSASLHLDSGLKVNLVEQVENDEIIVSFVDKTQCAKIVALLSSMLKKINYDAMNGALKWKIKIKVDTMKNFGR